MIRGKRRNPKLVRGAKTKRRTGWLRGLAKKEGYLGGRQKLKAKSKR